LKDSGPLLLVVPNLLAVCSISDFRDLASRAGKQAALRIARAARRTAGTPPAFSSRRYRESRLRPMLERLGFDVVHWSMDGRGLHTPLAPLAPGFARRHACRHVVLCEKRPGYFGFDDPSRYPEVLSHRGEYASEHHRFLQIRDQWQARHQSLAPASPQPIDLDVHAGREVLVLAPHPDDEIIGCGGTLLRLIASGARVTVIHATDGGASLALRGASEDSRRTTRIEEARAVGRTLGAREVLFWREDNRQFRPCEQRSVELRAWIEARRPSLIFTPFVTDVHDDHLTLNRILARALATAAIDLSSTSIVCYEVWSLVPANLFCDITAFASRRDDLLRLYRTAMKVDDFIHMCAHRNYYNAYTFAGGPGLVEAFYATPAPAFGSLLDSVEAPRA